MTAEVSATIGCRFFLFAILTGGGPRLSFVPTVSYDDAESCPMRNDDRNRFLDK
jgi:hypothetical protein